MIPTGFTPAGASNTDLELWAPKYTANNAPTTGARIKIELN